LPAAGGDAPSAPAAATTLTPGDVASIDTRGTVTITHLSDPQRYTAWTEDRLVYRDLPLAAVLADLSLVYGVAVTLDDPALGQRRVTLDMPARSLESTVQAIATVLELSTLRAGDGFVVRAPTRR
jgi:ferric-dicitrate binding protein FerR (iron transport regulator)